jgi:hypothetical protein
METTIETTIEKIKVSVIKNDIKKLSEGQKFLRNQRKTVRLKGKRTMEPWVAACSHQASREKLRLMYAAYGLMRGKSFSQMEHNHAEEEHPLKNFLPQINKMIEDYNKLEGELQKLK